MTRPHDPGAAGYLVAFVVGGAVFALLTYPFAETGHAGAFGAGVLFLVTLGYLGLLTLGIPFLAAFAVVLGLHRLVRHHPDQLHHVLLAAAAGQGLALCLARGLDRPGDQLLLVVALPVSTALGRWAVVPLVHLRRRRAAIGP